MTYTIPIKITIPVPIDEGRKKGPFGTTAGANFRLRCSEDEYTLIHEEANHIGVKGSSFARCAVVSAANALRKHRLAGSELDEAEDTNGTR